MQYSSSDRYQGEKGREYFAYQQASAEGAVLEVAKFAEHVRAEDRVLDFGCGGGWVLAELRCRARTGVEVNEAAHKFCRTNGVEVFRHISDVPSADFDLIISNHCLEHVPSPVEALRGLCALLRGGGKLVLALPLDDWRAQKDFTGKDIDHHLHTWTPRLLANTLAEAGLFVESVRVLTYAWPPSWRKFIKIFPRPAFDCLCWLTATLKKRRQLVAVATKKA